MEQKENLNIVSENNSFENLVFKKGITGLILWLITCIFGSIIIVEIERYLFNQSAEFHMSLRDGILLWFFVTLITFSVSSPFIFLIYYFARKNGKLKKVLIFGLCSSFIIFYLIVWHLSKKPLEALYLIFPYYFFAFILGFGYLRIER